MPGVWSVGRKMPRVWSVGDKNVWSVRRKKYLKLVISLCGRKIGLKLVVSKDGGAFCDRGYGVEHWCSVGSEGAILMLEGRW